MQMTGYETRSVFERYNIVSEGDLLAAAAKLDAVTADRVLDKVSSFASDAQGSNRCKSKHPQDLPSVRL